MYSGPITACAFTKNGEILTGCGSQVRLLKTGDLLKTSSLSPGAVVHGIRADGRITFGGRWLRISNELQPRMFYHAVLDAYELENNKQFVVVSLSSGDIIKLKIHDLDYKVVFKRCD